MGRGYVGGSGPFNLPAFQTAFQPIVDVAKRTILAYEALTRGTDGTSYPQLIGHLDAAALRVFHRQSAEATIQLAARLGIAELGASLCLNVQPDLHPDALNSDFVAKTAKNLGLLPANILLEFTEEHRLSIAEYKQLMERNRRAGFATGMDDFGAGYSGVAALVECHPEVLKLDRSLVRGIDTSFTRQKFVAAFVGCCEALDIRLIAEGIETEAECAMLLELGVPLMQGYLFSHPVVNQLPVETVWGVDAPMRRRPHGVRSSLLANFGPEPLSALILQA
jgi:EAL domain-containing protein (putative c-di-GMP-specific phosphodiesterase class I)